MHLHQNQLDSPIPTEIGDLTSFGQGNYWNAAFAECPKNYTIVGGGFTDPSTSIDDQDDSYPINNGWYCADDFNDAPAVAIMKHNIVSGFAKQTNGQKII